MVNPRGDLSSISRTLKRYARRGDVAGLRIYVANEAFLAAFNGLEPKRRQNVMLAYVEAHALREANTKLPIAAPVALNARARQKLANWRDPDMQKAD